MARRSTMRDVSRATGLSIFTVSRALSDADGVSSESREQVLRAARDLGYIPNRAAQELRKSSRDSIALITASTSNTYYLDLMAGIQQALAPMRWTVVVNDIAVGGAYDGDLEDRIVQRLIESRMAGVISTLTLKPENAQLLAAWDIPVVFVDSWPPASHRDFPSVTTDNYSASLAVGAHIAEHGYRDWLFLAYPAKWSSRFDRERGLRDAAKRGGAEFIVLESENDAESGRETLRRHLDQRRGLPDVLIAGNNPLLLGALNLVRERGLRVPEDMALVGYDEFDWAPLVDPPLTVLNESSGEIGRRAGAILADIIQRQSDAEKAGTSRTPVYTPDLQQQVPAELIIRRSCGCPFDGRQLETDKRASPAR